MLENMPVSRFMRMDELAHQTKTSKSGNKLIQAWGFAKFAGSTAIQCGFTVLLAKLDTKLKADRIAADLAPNSYLILSAL